MSRTAFGRPGISPRWTSSSKEAIGTAYSAASRVWFTISHGILNEVYYPTIDRPQIRDLQFLVTDGQSFFHAEQRDLDTQIECLEAQVLGYRIIKRDRHQRYQIVKEIITDPHQPCVLIHAKLEGDPEWLNRLQLYVLLAPHLNVGGWGNTARRMCSIGHDILVAWKDSTSLALAADVGFLRTSCGYVGASDGWQDLHDNFAMDWTFDSAEDGNVAVMGQIDVSRTREFTVGLAFGDALHAALTSLHQSLAQPFSAHRDRYVEQWHRACHGVLPLDQASCDQGRLYRISHGLLLAHEDKAFAGALVASASIPWGEAKGDEDLGGYHLVWTRDMVQSATALLASGNVATPRRALVYLACAQQADGGFSQNFWIDGTPYWHGIQLDEVAFPILLAWRLWQTDALQDFDPYPMVRAAAAYLVLHGPMTEQERWEECSGYSPSTLAVTIAGLICAAAFARDHNDGAAATFLEEYADFLESHVERWTVTTEGTLVPGITRHYIRIDPQRINNCTPDEDPNTGTFVIRNRSPRSQQEFPAKEIVDAGFLELVRHGIRPPDDALIEDSLRVVDAVLKIETPNGPCWHRYNHDGYGQRPDGGPFEGWGKGRAWPLLTGERGHYEVACGRDPKMYIEAMERFASGSGMLPEQVWDEPDLPAAKMRLGEPTGSAMPLMWAHAEYVKLLRSRADQRVFDAVSIVSDRYLPGRGRKDLEVWKHIRQVGHVQPGQVLRIQTSDPFRLHWSRDDWRTVQDADAETTSLGIAYIDVPISKDQKAPIRFTFYWPGAGRWEGKDYLVHVRCDSAHSC